MKLIFTSGVLLHNFNCLFTYAIEDSKHFLAIDFNGKFLVGTAKSETANEETQKWWAEFTVNPNKKENVDSLIKLVRNIDYYDLLENTILAYKEYLRVSNAEFFLNPHSKDAITNEIFPVESFELMKEWYNNLRFLKFRNYQERSIDKYTQDIENEVENDLIAELLLEIETKYFNTNKPEGLGKIAPRLRNSDELFKPRKIDTIPVKCFHTWLKQKLIAPQQNIPECKNDIEKTHENPHPRIFKNIDSFLLFESLKNDVRALKELADFSFIYRRMQKDGFIYDGIVDTEFREFLSKEYSVSIDKMKLLDYCRTDLKENSYTSKKAMFKQL